MVPNCGGFRVPHSVDLVDLVVSVIGAGIVPTVMDCPIWYFSTLIVASWVSQRYCVDRCPDTPNIP